MCQQRRQLFKLYRRPIPRGTGLFLFAATEEDDETNQVPGTKLLANRKEAALMLGCNIATILRLEQDGSLTPVKLTRGQNDGRLSKTYYRVRDIEALIERSVVTG